MQISGEDEYPLQELDLHYSVNGAPEKIVSLLKEQGREEGRRHHLLSMEDFKLVPGDIVSIYATAQRRQELGEDGHVLHPGRAV